MKTKQILSLVLALAIAVTAPLELLAKGAGGFSSGGGRSFSSGSRSFSSGSSSRNFSTPSRSFSSPSSSPSSGFGFSWKSTPSAPKTTYDSGATRALRQEQSRTTYQNTLRPAEVPSFQKLGREVSPERLQTHETRSRQTFTTYYSRPAPTIVYHDSFNPWFWMWLADQNQRDRDLWVYNHRDEMDPARYNEMKAKDADLDNRLRALESQGTAKDSSYTPNGVDSDLMYTDQHVQEAYNDAHSSHFPWFALLVVLSLGALFYLVFFVRFNVDARRRNR